MEDLGGREGDYDHWDKIANKFTLAFGVVPDKDSVNIVLDADGNIDEALSDTSGATKNGLALADYNDDKEAFAEAVALQFYNEVSDQEYNGKPLKAYNEEAQAAVIDTIFNFPEASGWNDVSLFLDESDNIGTEDYNRDNLLQFTQNFRAGGKFLPGMLKRRLLAYNMAAPLEDRAANIVTEAREENGTRTGTLYKIYNANGDLMQTWEKDYILTDLGTLPVE
jgi:hypothetical protein